MKNNVVLTGDGPLFWEVRDFLCDFSVQVFTLEETIPPSVRAVIDVEIGMDEKKQNNLQYVESQIASNVPIFSSVLYRTATEIASWLQHPERVVGFSPLMIHQIHVLEVSCPLQA
jgi:3-hydroxybutyryl-CoA dehydrogenase